MTGLMVTSLSPQTELVYIDGVEGHLKSAGFDSKWNRPSRQSARHFQNGSCALKLRLEQFKRRIAQ
jgi:hypothetical protein